MKEDTPILDLEKARSLVAEAGLSIQATHLRMKLPWYREAKAYIEGFAAGQKSLLSELEKAAKNYTCCYEESVCDCCRDTWKLVSEIRALPIEWGKT